MLEIEALYVAIGAGGSQRELVRDVSLMVNAGEVLGVAGASGCGKTTLALAVMGLLPPQLRIAAGSIRYRGQELVGL